MGGFAISDAFGCACEWKILLAPVPYHTSIDEDGKEEIVEHAAHHNQESLPSGLCSKFPWLWLTRKFVGALSLVDHTSDGAIAAQWQPAQAILGVFLAGGLFFCLNALRLINCAFAGAKHAYFLRFRKPSHQCDPWIKEKVEFFYFHAEDSCPHIVAKFVDKHQQTQRKYQFKCF